MEMIKIESEITIIVPHELHKQTSVLITVGAIQKLMRRVGCESYDLIDEDIEHDYRIYTYTVSYPDKFHKDIMKDLAEKDHFHYELMIIEE